MTCLAQSDSHGLSPRLGDQPVAIPRLGDQPVAIPRLGDQPVAIPRLGDQPVAIFITNSHLGRPQIQ